MQIGDAQLIADGTGIRTIADFRSADIAAGGQGAPLAPFFHEWLFRSRGETRSVLNIGGVANVTVLADDQDTIGFDTGPGNSLMDVWIRKHRELPFDHNGEWASDGNVDFALLEQFLSDPYFRFRATKKYRLRTLQPGLDRRSRCQLGQSRGRPGDTMCLLSAVTIADSVSDYAPGTSELLVCGGGAHNPVLLNELAARLPETSVAPTSEAGLDPDWVEAVALAWLAMRNLQDLPGNLPSVTGAGESVILGSRFTPR